MRDLDSVRPQAVAALDRLSNLLADNPDVRELREAGVRRSSIEALYPFDLTDWQQKIKEISGPDDAYATWRFLVPGHSTLNEMARCLLRETLPQAEGALNKLESGTAYESVAAALAARFEVTVLVLEMIRRSVALDPGYSHMFFNRANRFFAEVDQLLQALEDDSKIVLPF